MIIIKNLKVFNCNINESFHWSKLPKLKYKMKTKEFMFPSFANLCGADLRSANLRFANLSSADLSSADLRDANLHDANLCGADLRSANLSGVNLSYVNLHSADLYGVKLNSIDDNLVIIQDYMTVTGLGSENLQTVIYKTNIGIVLQCGCYYGTEKEFKKQVKETHSGTNYEKEYMEMLKLAKIRFSRKDK